MYIFIYISMYSFVLSCTQQESNNQQSKPKIKLCRIKHKPTVRQASPRQTLPAFKHLQRTPPIHMLRGRNHRTKQMCANQVPCSQSCHKHRNLSKHCANGHQQHATDTL
uniref:Putative secreted protein n=1 Tax=Amblyomma cajennense TaxID=34607 RepID=A0A023FDW1_AMBCJ